MRLIAPSILAADFLNLGREIAFLNESADIIHLDIMDGTLVPNISFGFSVVEPVSKIATIPMDAHLMIVHPENYFERLVKLGIQMISFHAEAVEREGESVIDFIKNLKAMGVKAGVAINPDYPIEKALEFVSEADYIVVMSVFAGFGGQKFIEATYDRVKALKSRIRETGSECLIQVDGGVGVGNIGTLEEAGVDMFVAGSSVFRGGNPPEAIKSLREA